MEASGRQRFAVSGQVKPLEAQSFEYEETMNKAKALFRAIEMAEEV